MRLISATNTPVHELVDNGEFRSDLLYRINTVEIYLPALRERVGDIALIARHYLKVYGEKYNKTGLRIDAKVIKKLETYTWPGNVRELQHSVERSVILTGQNVLRAEDFLLTAERKKSAKKSASYNIEGIERKAIENAIDKWEGNLTKAAKELGWGRSTLYRKMTRYGL